MSRLHFLLALFTTSVGFSAANCRAEFVGLTGTWHRDASFGTLNTIDDALNAVDGRIGDARFGVIDIDYPAGSVNTVSTGSTSLVDFLGTNAYGIQARSGMSLTDSLYSQLTNSVFVFSGTLDVDETHDNDTSDSGIDVTFRVGSDDGFRLMIGTQVLGSHNVRGFQNTDLDFEFSTAGQYDFELVYFERAGNTGVDLDWRAGGGSTFESISISAIPEPSSLAMLGLVSAGLVSRRRRR
ncbi:MAG: PEP-CTERM sorting domain-containing protein [Planctomycetota bacterium]